MTKTLLPFRARGAWICLFFTGFVACKSSSSSNGPDPTSFIEDYCTTFATCCGGQHLPADGIQCKSDLQDSFDGYTFDTDAGTTCLNALHAAAAADPNWCASTKVNLDLFTACSNIYAGGTPTNAGTSPSAGPCTKDADCFQSPSDFESVCVNIGQNGQGACATFTRGKQGDSCIRSRSYSSTYVPVPVLLSSFSGAECIYEDQLYCDPTTTKCQPLLAIGADCPTQNLASCVVGSYCDPGSATCTANLAVGAACQASVQCVNRSACSGTCTALAADGATCKVNGDCQSNGCFQGVCIGATFDDPLIECGVAASP